VHDGVSLRELASCGATFACSAVQHPNPLLFGRGVSGLLLKACGRAQASADAGARTVVVFEEVDNLADADRGFLSALAALIAESKARGPAGRRSPCRVAPLTPATAGMPHACCCRRLAR